MEAVYIVVQPSFAHAADMLCVDHHADAHGDIEMIRAIFQLLTHAAAFPGVPVRHMRERGLAVQRLQCPEFC